MFGYVVFNKAELKFKDFDIYKSYYCGLCRDLNDMFGAKGQVTLNFDMTFLAILLDGLYETETEISECRCIVHPLKKHSTRRNEFTRYAAEMNIVLSYYKCLDDWVDDHNRKRKRFAKSLEKYAERVRNKYPEKCRKIEELLKQLDGLERNGEYDLDALSGCFGKIMAELFCYKDDEWKQYIENIGFFLGKYIYILDSYCDYPEDKKKGRFNALEKFGTDKDKIQNLLVMMMAECTRNYEMLPIVENCDILKNILYDGVWMGFTIEKKPVDHI